MSSTHHKNLMVFVLAAFVGLLAHPCAASILGAGGRTFVTLGPWISKFEQSDGSHEVKLTTMTSAAAQFQAGINVSIFFIEYNASWLISAYSGNPKTRDASYFSPLGVNIGIDLPILPVEFYIGGEKGTYKLNGGVNPSYSGNAAKAGINFAFRAPGAAHASVGIKAEYRRFYGTGDDAGSFPSGFTTRADTFLVGLTFGQK